MALRKGRPSPIGERPKAEVKVETPDPYSELRAIMTSKTVIKATEKMNEVYENGKDGAGFLYGPNRPMPRLGVFSTGIPEVDYTVIGRGGIPRGRATEISGPESCGKTTFVLALIAFSQRKGLKVGFVDVENAMDGEYASAMNVQTDLWFYGIPMTGEAAIQMADDMLSGKLGVAVDLAIVDSSGALKKKLEKEKPLMGKKSVRQIGARADLQERLIGKTKESLFRNQSSLVVISQVRMNMDAGLYGKKYRTTTSKELDHEFSLHIEMAKGEAIKKGDSIIGRQLKFKAVKNKIGDPEQKCVVDLFYGGDGLSMECILLDSALRANVVGQEGIYYYYEGENIGKGREEAKAWFRTHPEIAAEIQTKVQAVHQSGRKPDLPAIPDALEEIVTFDDD